MINSEIRNQTIRNLKLYRGLNKEDITERIRDLNLEWDTERVLEANAAVWLLISSILGFKFGRFWFLVTGFLGSFMLQHALQGWCPPIPFIRRWGIRTEDEINAEKTVLKMIRGDFNEENSSLEDILSIAEKQ